MNLMNQAEAEISKHIVFIVFLYILNVAEHTLCDT